MFTVGAVKKCPKSMFNTRTGENCCFGISLNGQLLVHCVIPESKAYNYRLRLSHDGFGL